MSLLQQRARPYQFGRLISKPDSYAVYANPYTHISRAAGGVRAKAELEITSNALANFDGLEIVANLFLNDGSVVPLTMTFDDDAAPPSTSAIIKIMGLTTAVQIAAQVAAAFELNGFEVFQDDPAEARLTIFQPRAGATGNADIDPNSSLSQEVRVNGITDFAGIRPMFYGGADIDVPGIIGKIRCFLPQGASYLRGRQLPG